MLNLEHDITNLRGAEYNPRFIEGEDLAALATSIQTLGLVKPLIARGNLLVAGHQRTRALRSIGINRAPVYLLSSDTTTYDEVRFNQLHNGTDMDCGEENAVISCALVEGYQIVPADQVSGDLRCRMGPLRGEIAKMITKYGPWGGVVATLDGRIIHCGQYALAAMMTGTPLTVYGVPVEREAEYRKFLDRRYGVFSYKNLKRDTYIQTYAQMMRLRAGPSGKEQRSTLYEQVVLPWLAKHQKRRGLDFGSGQGDYAAHLRLKGENLVDLEFLRRARGRDAIDMKAVNGMIDKVVSDLNTLGRYDYLVCDSVMNSVDSIEAETSVLSTLNFLTEKGGALFLSGRKMERVVSEQMHTKMVGKNRYVEFLDEHGFSALFRKGRWFYQKFHDREQVERLLAEHGFAIQQHDRTRSSTSWQVMAKKIVDLPLERVLAALEFEFNLPVSDTKRIGRHDDLMACARRLYAE